MADTTSEIPPAPETPAIPETPATPETRATPRTASHKRMDGIKENEAGISASQQRKRPASTEGLPFVPLLKRSRLTDKADKYCWFCHEDGGPFLLCDLCPRSYHPKCVALPDMNNTMQWICPECEKVMRAESEETRSKSMSLLQKDSFHLLLKYALERLQSAPQADAFREPVNVDQVPQYKEFIVYPCALSTIEQSIALKLYGCTEAFLSDVKWIVHNCIIFNGTHHALTTSARTLLKMCKHEVTEIEICPECYQNSCARQKDTDWFCLPCKNPHPLVWAKLKGYPFWPAKALRELDGDVDVRFFGAHDRAWVPMNQVYYLSLECPAPAKGRKSGFDEAMRELGLHVKKLREAFGRYDYAPLKTPYKAMAVAGTTAGAKVSTVRPTGQQRSQSNRKHTIDRKSEPSIRSRLAQSSATSRMRTAATADGATSVSPRPSVSAVPCATSPRSSRTPRLASKHHLFIKHPLGGAGDADANRCGGDASSFGEETSPDNGCTATTSSLSSTSQASLVSQLAEGGPPNSGFVSTLVSTEPVAAGKPRACDSRMSGTETKMEEEDDSGEHGELCDRTADKTPGLHVTPARPATSTSSNGHGDDARERSRTPEMPKLTLFTEERHVGLLAVCPSVVAAGNCPTLTGAPVSGATSLGSSTDLSGAPICESGSSQHASVSASTNLLLSPSDGTASLTAITGKECGNSEKESADRDKELESGKNKKEGWTEILEKGDDKDGKVDANIGGSQLLAPGVLSDTNEIPQNDAFFENLAQTIETCKAQLGLSDAQPCDDSEDDDDSQSCRSESSSDDNSGKHSSSDPSLGRTASATNNGSSSCATQRAITCNVCSKPKSVDFDGSPATASSRNICRGCGNTKDATAVTSVLNDKSNSVTVAEPTKESNVSSQAGASSNADSPRAAASAARSAVVAQTYCRDYNTVSKSLISEEFGSAVTPASSAAAPNKLAIGAESSDKPSGQHASSSAYNTPSAAAKNGNGAHAATQALPSKVPSIPAVSSMAAGSKLSPAFVTYGGANAGKPICDATAERPMSGAASGKAVSGPASGKSVSGAASAGQPVPSCTSGILGTRVYPGKIISMASARALISGTSSGSPQNGVMTKIATDEITRLLFVHQLELTEVKHARGLLIDELRRGSEFEKLKALIKARKLAEEQVNKAIEDTKSKQWCSNCRQEAKLYCCWNTSYCDYPCQQLHWDQHMLVCSQLTPEALAMALMSNGDDSGSNVTASNDSVAAVTEVMAAAPVTSQLSASLSKPLSAAGVVPQQQASASAVSLLQQQQTFARHRSTPLNGDRSVEQKQARSAGAVAIVNNDQQGLQRAVTFSAGNRRQQQQVGSLVTATSVSPAVPAPGAQGTVSTRRPAPTVLVVDSDTSFATLRQQSVTSSPLTLAGFGRNSLTVGAGTSRHQAKAWPPVPVTVTVRSNSTGAVLGGAIPGQQPLPTRLLTTADVLRRRNTSLLSGRAQRQQTSAVTGGRNGTIPAPFFHSPASAQSGAGQSRPSGTGGPLGSRRSAQ